MVRFLRILNRILIGEYLKIFERIGFVVVTTDGIKKVASR